MTIKMHPREPLTKKARAAISAYAAKKGKGLNIHYYMVNHVLTAERMPRERLYKQLTDWGYRWYPKLGMWIDDSKQVTK